MKLLLISVHYPPFKSSCAIQMSDLAEQLLFEGHSPTIIVPDENINCLCIKEKINGIPIYRLSTPKIINISVSRRAINETFLSFHMIKGLKKTDLDIHSFNGVIWYSPSIFFGPLIWYLKKNYKMKSYLILRDIFPEWALDLGLLKKGPIYYFFKVFAQFQYNVADKIGVQTESNLMYFSKKLHRKKEKKIEVLNNWLTNRTPTKCSIDIKQTILKNKKIFVYIGNMGIAQGMDIILDLVIYHKRDPQIGFLFVGRGSELEKLKKRSLENNLKNILFFDSLEPSELENLLKKCHVGIVALDTRHRSHNIPGKFLTYMQSGLPVLARINKNTDLEKIININNVGKVYCDDNIKDLYICSKELIENEIERQKMSRNGVKLSKKMFSSSSATKTILKTFLD